jgi:hypothetical protein
MAYTIQWQNGQWLVYIDDVLVFAGTYRQYEDWLDRAENCQRLRRAGRPPPPAPPTQRPTAGPSGADTSLLFDLVVSKLRTSQSHAELIEVMRQLRDVREKPIAVVVCAIEGFENDPRQLGQIPELRAFCRRLVDLGFISWLEPTTTLSLLISEYVQQAYPSLGTYLGAWEVWAIAQGLCNRPDGAYPATVGEVLRWMRADLLNANARSEQTLGRRPIP